MIWSRGLASSPMSFLQASQDCSPVWCTSKRGWLFMVQLPLPTLQEQVHQESPAALLHCPPAVAAAHCGIHLGPVWVLQVGIQRSLGSDQSSCCSFKCCCRGHWSGRVPLAPGYREGATASGGSYCQVWTGPALHATQTPWSQGYLTSGLLLWQLLHQPNMSPALTNLVSSLHMFLPPFQFLLARLILPFNDNFQETIFKHKCCLFFNCTRQ